KSAFAYGRKLFPFPLLSWMLYLHRHFHSKKQRRNGGDASRCETQDSGYYRRIVLSGIASGQANSLLNTIEVQQKKRLHASCISLPGILLVSWPQKRFRNLIRNN